MRTAHRRLAALGTLTAGSVLLLAGPAFAHVTVNPQSAPKGGYSTVDVKVPNERDDASTVKVEVDLPKDHPVSSVSAQPVPGWDVQITKSHLDKPITVHGQKVDEAVTRITWTGGKIGPGRFQQFPLSLGPLPKDTDRLALKALQTYSSGEVVRWIEIPQDGQPEPEHPAPVLHLTAAGAQGHDQAATDTKNPSADTGTRHDDTAAGDSTDTTARVLGIVGIVVGVAGAAAGVLAGRRRSA
jgi:uncharacterized protein YcnI